MQSDLFLVIGILIAALALVALVSAYSDRRRPRAGAIMVLMATGLIGLAHYAKPEGYRLAEIPDVFIRVIGHLLQ
jgi:NhaP-type Na+/H+ or K+/H+ antiporter